MTVAKSKLTKAMSTSPAVQCTTANAISEPRPVAQIEYSGSCTISQAKFSANVHPTYCFTSLTLAIAAGDMFENFTASVSPLSVVRHFVTDLFKA
jgi:hypothetical protein